MTFIDDIPYLLDVITWLKVIVLNHSSSVMGKQVSFKMVFGIWKQVSLHVSTKSGLGFFY